MQDIKFKYAANRTEEFGKDLWDKFILPPYFKDLEFGHQFKPIRFIGGRGSGKTALLRFLSHRSQFSESREKYSERSLKDIGIYFKAELSFVTLFTGEDKTEKKWIDIFTHGICLAISEELVDLAIRILENRHRLADQCPEGLPDTIEFKEVKVFNPSFSTAAHELANDLRLERYALSTWLKNIENDDLKPRLLPLKDFVGSIVRTLKESISFLSDSTFNILIDEYENFFDYQQRVVNTLIKGYEFPIAYHVALKPNGMRTTETLGTEHIQEKNDYRTINIEERIAPHFEVFCAELFFFRLFGDVNAKNVLPFSHDDLRDQEKLELRFPTATNKYQKELIGRISQIFPQPSTKELCIRTLQDNALKSRWDKVIQTGIGNKEGNYDAESYFDLGHPEASVVSAILVNQRSKNLSILFREFEKYRVGEKSQYSEWIHKYLNGALFLLWITSRKPNILYAGFKTFQNLSKTNIRHFIELCHISIKKQGEEQPIENIYDFSCSLKSQALAAKETGNYFFEETKSSGSRGNHLYALIESVGKIFQYSQERYSQSEFERTHFAIISGNTSLSDSAQELLKEAVKWSVFYTETETKVKGERLESYDYILNPIYAPFFNISFRKGRKLEINTDQAEILLTGDLAARDKLYKDLRVKLLGEEAKGQGSLLDYLDE